MDKATQESLMGLVNSGIWQILRDELIGPTISNYADVSIPFKYGDKELEGTDSYYAKVGATVALKELVKTINRMKKSKPAKVENFE